MPNNATREQRNNALTTRQRQAAGAAQSAQIGKRDQRYNNEFGTFTITTKRL